ncbi:MULTISPECIES: DUF4169 family protein [Chelativorans]|jgi:hypothetical protein|uniref:DUF4169 family protein n=1 Tax=Chelativorans TaxID=449972 RepID=UPI00030C4642|nr:MULTISPECIES: DUF4169 family protein [Chelativorans]
MGELVNLRLVRKRKNRAQKEQIAAENRTRFGQPRAKREADRRAEALDAARLEAHRRLVSPDEDK